MQKRRTPKTGKIIAIVFWSVVITITAVCLISQQMKLNSENSRNKAADKTLAERREHWDEIASEDPSMTDEEIERVARGELDMIFDTDVVVVGDKQS